MPAVPAGGNISPEARSPASRTMEDVMNLRSLMPIGRDRNVARQQSSNPFMSLQQEIDRLFDDFGRGWPTLPATTAEMTPRMDVAETDKEYEISAELPGLEEKDVQVNVADDVLTIKGEKK